MLNLKLHTGVLTFSYGRFPTKEAPALVSNREAFQHSRQFSDSRGISLSVGVNTSPEDAS